MRQVRFSILFPAFLLIGGMLTAPIPASGESGEALYRDAYNALQKLYAQSSSAAALGRSAKAVLVFPNIVKGGFIVGGQYGEGVLFMNGKTAGYYSTVQASYGLQAGVQKYGYALFLMDHAAIDWVNKTGGWEVGTGPSIVVVDKGKAGSMTTTTLHSGIYAFFFGQQGLMAGLGMQGTKITRINK